MSEIEQIKEPGEGVQMTANFSVGNLGLGALGTAAFPMLSLPPMGPLGVAPEVVLPEFTREELVNALAYSPNALNRMAQKLTAYNPDALIQNKGYGEMDRLRTMAVYMTPLHLLVASTLCKEWSIRAKVNGKIADSTNPRFEAAMMCQRFINYCCRNIMDIESGYDRQDFREVVSAALENGTHIGHSVQEIQYRSIQEGEFKGKLGLQRIIYRPHQNVRFALDPRTDQIRYINIFTPLGGWNSEIRRDKFIIYTFRKQKGLPYGWGLSRVCYKHTHAIDILTRLLGDALQRFGMGFLKATVTNPSPEFIAKVQSLLNNVANGQPLVLTPDIGVELLSLAGGGLDPIEKAMRYHGEQISSHILGQTLTTSTGGSAGSYALASVHQGTQKYFTGFPRRDIEVEFEHQLFTQLIVKNFGIEYMDCVPALDLGVYDHEEAAIVAGYTGVFIDKGVMNPNETQIRDRAVLSPYDPSTPKASILPDKVQERITVMENPDGSKVTTKDSGDSGSSSGSGGGE